MIRTAESVSSLDRTAPILQVHLFEHLRIIANGDLLPFPSPEKVADLLVHLLLH